MAYSVSLLQDSHTGSRYRVEGDVAMSKVPHTPYDVRLYEGSKSRQMQSTYT